MPGDSENVFPSWADVIAQCNFMLQIYIYQLSHFVHLSLFHELKHLHNVETRLHCPQTFLSLDSSVGMTLLK